MLNRRIWLVPTRLLIWQLLVVVVFVTLVQADGASTETPKVTVLEGTVELYTMSVTSGSLTPTTTTSGVSLPANTQPCNGYVELCTRSYGNITYVAAHNSPFVMQNNVAANQNLEVAQQLGDGIRMCKFGEFHKDMQMLIVRECAVQGQTHELNGALHYCHTRYVCQFHSFENY